MNRNNLRKFLTARSKAVEVVHWRNKQHRFQMKSLKEFEKSFRTKEGIYDERSLSDADADNAEVDYQHNSKRNPSSHTETSSSSSNKMVMKPSAQSNEYGTVGHVSFICHPHFRLNRRLCHEDFFYYCNMTETIFICCCRRHE